MYLLTKSLMTINSKYKQKMETYQQIENLINQCWKDLDNENNNMEYTNALNRAIFALGELKRFY